MPVEVTVSTVKRQSVERFRLVCSRAATPDPLPNDLPVRGGRGGSRGLVAAPMGKGKRQRTLRDRGQAAGLPTVAQFLRDDPDARRIAALTLSRVAGWNVAKIRKSFPGISKSSVARWSAAIEKGETLARKPRKRVYRLQEADIVATMLEVQKPLGKRPATNLTTAVRKLKARNAVRSAHLTTFSRALKREGWVEQPVKADLPLSPADCLARATFARREGRTIARDTFFTDSKVFPMIPDRSTRLGRAWAPKGQPLSSPVSQKSAGQVHAYGGICRMVGVVPYVSGWSFPITVSFTYRIVSNVYQ